MTKAIRTARHRASQFENFRSLTKSLVRVPKKELDEMLMKEQRARASKNGNAAVRVKK
jgi:hypothetical protein